MRILRLLHKRIRTLVHRSKQQNELLDEANLHFEQLVREHRDAGLDENEARLAARRDFGSEALTLESARDAWGWIWLNDVMKDVAYGLRLLYKSPGFTVTAVASLALGIGANTAIFSLVKQELLDSLPVREPQNLVRLTRSTLENSLVPSFSYPFLKDLQTARGIPFDGFLAMTGLGQMTMLIDGSAEPVTPVAVSGNYYQLLGVRPALGRLFTEADDNAVGANPVAVLSFNFWDSRFGRDPSILNKTIRLGGRPFTIIGVSAAGFDGLSLGQAADLQIPIAMGPYASAQILSRNDWWLDVYGRMKPGVTLASASDSLLPLLSRNYEIAGRVPKTDYQRRIRASERMQVVPAMHGAGASPNSQRALWVLMAMVISVLLLACVNIAHLLLARGSAREREHSIRAAIGASRGRLIRQNLAESLLLAFLGGALGVAVAYGFTAALLNLAVTDPGHSTLRVAPDSAILLFNFAIALAAGVLFGLAPAVHASRCNLLAGLKGALSAGVGRMAARKVLISVQVAISVVLVVAAGLFSRTLVDLRHLDLGFRSDHLIQFGLNPAGYPSEGVYAFFDRVRARIASMPGVEAVAIGRQRLIAGYQWGSGISVEGYVVPEGEFQPDHDAVSDGYFSALGIPLIAGREFEPADGSSAPKVAIVNESFARHYFPSQSPIGKRIGPGGKPPEFTIVGVVRDGKYVSMREETRRFWWAPYRQMGTDSKDLVRALTVFVRTSASPETMMISSRQAVASVDKSVAAFGMLTLDMQFDNNLSTERLLAMLSAFFAGLAALLAAVGLFGVLSFSVARREREIGIRMALGASPFQASWTVVGEIALYAVAGIAVGMATAFSSSKLIEGLLFGVRARDGMSLALACALTVIVVVLASMIPARRAASVPPAVAFRSE